MITETIERSKSINDPLFTSINKYAQARLTDIKVNGTTTEYKLAQQRYSGLKPSEVIIEPPQTFAGGIIRACFLSRTRRFFHADALIETVGFNEILRDWDIVPKEYTKEDLEIAVQDKAVTFGIFYLTDTSEYVLVLNATKKAIDDVYKLLGELYWKKMTIDLSASQDGTTKRSGACTIECWGMNNQVLPIYYSNHFAAKKMKK